MHPSFSHAPNSIQAQQSSNGALPFDPSLHQSMLSNPTMFQNRQPMPNFNQNINNNGAGWPASPAMMPPPPNVAMMLQNSQMGLLPQLGPHLFALNPAAQQLAALQLQAQLQQNFNVLASLQNSNFQQNFNPGLGGVTNVNSNLQNLMIQGNQMGGPGANPGFGNSTHGSGDTPNAALGSFNLGLEGVCNGNANLQNLMIQGNQMGSPGANPGFGTSNPGSGDKSNAALGGFNLGLGGVRNGNANLQNLMIQGNQMGGPGANPGFSTSNPWSGDTPNAALGGQNSNFGKGTMHGDSRQNKFNRGTNYNKFQPSNSGSPAKRFQDMKRNKQERNRFQNHRFQNPQLASNMRNGAGESARTGGKGKDYWKGTPSDKTPSIGCKRSHLYTESEIRQWIEARKKNYPTSGKHELSQSISSSKVADDEAKLRKQQMKDVLAKQAELGVEVAEVPPSYLSETENEVGRHKRNRRGMHNGRRPNIRSDASASSSQIVVKREPTLLQKLLSKEIRGDNYRILQAFRFMTLNNFFEDLTDKPLVYPDVSVKDEGCISEIVKSKAQEEANSEKAGPGKNNDAKDSQELHEVDKVSEVADEDEDKEQLKESEEGELTE